MLQSSAGNAIGRGKPGQTGLPTLRAGESALPGQNTSDSFVWPETLRLHLATVGGVSSPHGSRGLLSHPTDPAYKRGRWPPEVGSPRQGSCKQRHTHTPRSPVSRLTSGSLFLWPHQTWDSPPKLAKRKQNLPHGRPQPKRNWRSGGGGKNPGFYFGFWSFGGFPRAQLRFCRAGTNSSGQAGTTGTQPHQPCQAHGPEGKAIDRLPASCGGHLSLERHPVAGLAHCGTPTLVPLRGQISQGSNSLLFS